jgi:hypothetical protein
MKDILIFASAWILWLATTICAIGGIQLIAKVITNKIVRR